MTPGDDSGRRPSGLSRRRLLAGIGGVGAVGMASGLGTGAYLADRETFRDNIFGAGEVGLTVNDELTDGAVTVGPFAVDRTTFDGRPDPERFEIGASANPVRVWLATECPDDDPLGDALEIEVVVDGEPLTDGHQPIDEVERLLATGRRIDDGCLEPGPDGGSIRVEVSPYLPFDAPDEVASSETDLTFRLYAEQCRHVSEADAAASNPYAEVACEEPKSDCPACVEFGKAEFGESTAPGDIIPLEMSAEGAEPHEIAITEVETKDGETGDVVGVAFTLRDADGNPGPDMCSVAVKGGPDRSPEAVAIDPVSPETGTLVFAPLIDEGGEGYGVSNVTIGVCAGEGEGARSDELPDDGDDSGAGEGARVEDDESTGDSNGKGPNGTENGNGPNGTENRNGRSGDESGNDDREAN